MFKSPFFRRLFWSYLLLIWAAMAVVGLFAARTVRQSYNDRQTQGLHQSAALLANELAARLTGHFGDRLEGGLAQKLDLTARSLGFRITLVRSDGVVVYDSEHDPKTMVNHGNRPEILDASSKGEGVDRRPSETIHEPFVYLARQVSDVGGEMARARDGKTYVVRLAVRVEHLQHDLNLLYTALATAAVISGIGAAILGYYIARRHAASLIDLTEFADGLARGELNRRTHGREAGEMAALGASLNSMADSLQRLLEQSNKDKAELLAILSSMSEGVIATDTKQRVLLVNAAATRLLGFDAATAVGKSLWEVVRQEQILKAAGEVLSGEQRRMISIGPVSARHLDVTLCPFVEATTESAETHGLIIVAHDITQSFQYQELRKEFVANVSHELRTPLTVIKGFVETLQDGAWRDEKKAPEFLAVIARHSNQLGNLVGDLLELSKIESQGLAPGRGPVDISAVVQRAYELLQPAAQRKNQTVALEMSPGVPTIKGNADYLERAVANLIDNASKYTAEGGRITVRVRPNGQYVLVEVEDNGLGIPPEDVPRIFERFYRVDRSRSREMGGTGLGLSIVKHVAQVHGGSIEVESSPGEGSRFTLKIPC